MKEKHQIYLASYPRSGNTLFRLVLKECFNLETDTIYKNEGDLQNSVGLGLTNASYFVKTHEPEEDRSKTIYLVRNPIDAIVSYAHYYKREKSLDTNIRTLILKLVIQGKGNPFTGWGNHVSHWTNDPPKDLLVIKFEDLKSSPIEVVNSALKFHNLHNSIPSNAFPPFSYWHDKYPEFFRQGTGGYQNEFPLIARFILKFRWAKQIRDMGYKV
tara:strand:+ start:5623 stop:6264 length:642 start_codon:yes stop_codon:yes gene_type:complete